MCLRFPVDLIEGNFYWATLYFNVMWSLRFSDAAFILADSLRTVTVGQQLQRRIDNLIESVQRRNGKSVLCI